MKTRINGKKEKIPCLDYSEAMGLTFTLTSFPQSTDPPQIELTFTNPTDTLKSIYWYDFKDSWGVPLSCSFTLKASDGTLIHQNLNWGDYMDNHVFFAKEKVNEKIEIPPGQSLQRVIEVWWPSQKPGHYWLSLKYGGFVPSLSSNELSLRVKETPE